MKKKLFVCCLSLMGITSYSFGFCGVCADPPAITAQDKVLHAAFKAEEVTLAKQIDEINKFIEKKIIKAEQACNKKIEADSALLEDIALSKKHLAFVTQQNATLEDIVNNVTSISVENKKSRLFGF